MPKKVKFPYEKKVIDPILKSIKKHQEFLTQPENLPQLAKLGFMYNFLWYAGRVCWGYGGKISDGRECGNNPKYKIEMCDPKTDEIEELIYDAWGMHVSNFEDPLSFDEFMQKVNGGRELSPLEKKMLKVNKTFDEWVEILTDKNYRYSSIYPDRRSVADHLLCVIGNGYGINKDGFVYAEASGADQDQALYGDWENSQLVPEIRKVIDDIIVIPEFRLTIDTYYQFVMEIKEKKKSEERERNRTFYEVLKLNDLYDESEGDLRWDEIHRRMGILFKKSGIDREEKSEYNPYYPICDYSIIWIIGSQKEREKHGIKEVHQSYINACIEICEEIILNKEAEDKERKGNVTFAKKFLKNHKLQIV